MPKQNSIVIVLSKTNPKIVIDGTKEFHLDDYAEYEFHNNFSYYGKIVKITEDEIQIFDSTFDILHSLEPGEFLFRNRNFDKQKADGYNLDQAFQEYDFYNQIGY